MPKNKPKYKYVTSNGIKGMTFREISEYMIATTGHGSVAGVRYTFFEALKKIARGYLDYSQIDYDEDAIEKLVRTEEFQLYVRDLLSDLPEEDNV